MVATYSIIQVIVTFIVKLSFDLQLRLFWLIYKRRTVFLPAHNEELSMGSPTKSKIIISMAIAGLTLAGCASTANQGSSSTSSSSTSASTATSGSASAQYLVQNVGDRVFFQTDQSNLDGSARATLRNQAQWLAQNGSINLIIEGHADERGTREYNLALGARRANAVRDFLISEGVDGNRLQTISYGKERPVSLCSEEACWSKNRRSVATIR
jgi:peptidoglycan-associated lipoprotein